MASQVKEPTEPGEHTDELPVLSEATVLALAAEARSPEPGAADSLEHSMESLRQALERAEERWTSLETRLRAQDREIDSLRHRLGRAEPDRTEGSPGAETTPAGVPELTEVVTAAAGPADPAAAAPVNPDPALLERIAYLEAYISGRADRWDAMEAELDSKGARIAELERELEQRIAREENYAQRLKDEGDKADELRLKLQRANQRLEEKQLGRRPPDLDATQDIPGPANGSASPDSEPADGIRPDPGHDLPVLVCLTHDAPARVSIDKDRIVIGRGAECDIRILTHFVSRRHATIRREDRGDFIEDEGSTNGIYVNEERVDRRRLRDGDRITIGQSEFRFVGGQPQD